MSTKKEDTRARLFGAARKLLVARGFHGVGLEDIAEAAGVSRQAVYKSHFASKGELLIDLVRHLHVAEKLDEVARPYFAAQSGLEMLAEAIRAIVLIEQRIHDIALVLTAAASTDPGAKVASNERLEVKRRALRAAFARVQADGHFSAAWQLEEAVDVLAALLSVDTYERLVNEQGWPPEQLISRVLELAGAFLLRPPGRRTLPGASPKRGTRPERKRSRRA